MNFTSVLSEPFSGLTVFDQLTVIAFYMTIVFAVLFVAFALAVKKTKAEKLPEFFKAAKYITVGYALAFAIPMLVLKVSDSVAVGEFQPMLFWPIISIFITAFVLFLGGMLIYVKKREFLPKYKFICVFLVIIPVIVSIVMLANYYKTVAEYYDGVSQAGLYVSAVLLILLMVFASAFFGKKSKDGSISTREMAYAAISVSLAFALSYVRLFRLPQGGSVTLASMLPLMLFSYMFGVRKGVLAGVIFGILQAVQDPWIIHPAQFFLDYPVAFGMVGLAGIFKENGIFKNKKVIAFICGVTISVLLRYLSHAMSGVFAFASYGAAAGYSAVAWGFLYNAFSLVDGAICIVVGLALFSSKAFVKLLHEKSDGENAPSDTNNLTENN